ncbi:MAG: hypothetical protein ACLTSZ_08985 [Lachnospiraceae bacterium]
MSTRKGQRQSRIRNGWKSAQEEEEQQETAECDSGPPGRSGTHGIAGCRRRERPGAVCFAKAGQIPDEKKENGQKKGEISAVTKLRQQERQRRGKQFLVFGGLLFLSTALVCILPVRKKENVRLCVDFSTTVLSCPLKG